jgi:hypothetical protein
MKLLGRRGGGGDLKSDFLRKSVWAWKGVLLGWNWDMGWEGIWIFETGSGWGDIYPRPMVD